MILQLRVWLSITTCDAKRYEQRTTINDQRSTNRPLPGPSGPAAVETDTSTPSTRLASITLALATSVSYDSPDWLTITV
jgi:hypothetical protein